MKCATCSRGSNANGNKLLEVSVDAIGNIPTSRLQTGSLTQNQDFDEDFEEKDLAEDHDDFRIRTMW